jgi:hypothetical protein
MENMRKIIVRKSFSSLSLGKITIIFVKDPQVLFTSNRLSNV